MNAAASLRLPLFPLSCVLLPWGRLWLRIFEWRYLGMVRDCLAGDEEFGLTLVREGAMQQDKTGRRLPVLMPVGTTARIIDWQPLQHGRLGILIQGGRKFRVLSAAFEADRLLHGEVEFLRGDKCAKNIDCREMSEILRRLMQHPMLQKLDLHPDFEDPQQLSCMLAQFLPLPELTRYHLLILESASGRLAALQRHLKDLEDLHLVPDAPSQK